MPTLAPDAVWRLAEANWAAISEKQPDLQPAIALQRQLLRLLIDAATQIPGAVADIAPSSLEEKWARGLPALWNEPIVIPPSLRQWLPAICAALVEAGAGESAAHIGNAIVAGSIDADSLLRVSLTRNQKAIRTSALHMGLSPDLVWLIGELGSSPLAFRLSAGLQVGTAWDRGYCPCCGSWPVFIESIAGSRMLRCSYCTLPWSRTPATCVYCATSEQLITGALDVASPEQRVELCGSCGGYTKVLDARERTPFPLLAIDDLATLSLDRGAMERGYRRPDLFDLETIEPRLGGC